MPLVGAPNAAFGNWFRKNFDDPQNRKFFGLPPAAASGPQASLAAPGRVAMLVAAVRRRGDWGMRGLLAMAVIAVTCMVLAGTARAQGSCSGRCNTAHSQCQRQVAEAGGGCRRQYGGVARAAAECQRRERAYASACATRFRQCLRACGGR